MPPLRNLSFTKNDNLKQELMPNDPIKNLLLAVIIVLVIVAIFLYSVIFYYEKKNQKLVVNAKSIELELSAQPLVPMLGLYYDIKSVNEILANHDSVRFYLELMSDSVVDEVYFKSFSYDRVDSKNANIRLSAVGRDYASVVLQMDSFRKDKYKDVINRVEVSAISKDDAQSTFNIMLNVRADIDFINTQFVDKSYQVSSPTDSKPVVKEIIQ
jgi:hypothetical protein